MINLFCCNSFIIRPRELRAELSLTSSLAAHAQRSGHAVDFAGSRLSKIGAWENGLEIGLIH